MVPHVRRAIRNLIVRYQSDDWRPVFFQPVLAFFMFGAALRLLIEQSAPPPFEAVVGSWFYNVWLMLGMLCPPMILSAWFLIRHGGRATVMGMGLRLAGDIGLFTMLMAYHMTVVRLIPISETRLFSRYVVAAVMVFTLELVVRDLLAMAVVERTWRKRRGR